MAPGTNHPMGAMTGMTGMSATPQTMGRMAGHMTQMLGIMQERLVRIQALLKDSTVAHNPQTVRDLRQMQQHMASMMGAMGPMIARMQQMQRPDTAHHKMP
jgi:hypothetical protein